MEKALNELEQQLQGLDAADGLKLVGQLFAGEAVFSTSLGQEDQIITQMIAHANAAIQIFTLDTGRLFAETLDLWAQTEEEYGVKIVPYYPEHTAIEALVAANGINGFYDSVANRQACCYVRKVASLQRALKGNRVWVTGLRAQQSAGRSRVKLIEWDEAHQILKYNPLIDWSYDRVLTYIHHNAIPYNALHDKGFVSIGCAPCTRAIVPGEDARAGRWWWEQTHKECGLHIKQAQTT